jgi:lipopolysaccharide export system protein LptA
MLDKLIDHEPKIPNLINFASTFLKMNIFKPFFFFILLLFATHSLVAQNSNVLEIQSADLLQGANGFERLIKNVKMKHQSTLINCDSAHFFRVENVVKLYGNVRITDQKDPVKITSRYAEYDGNTKTAKLREKVVFKNESTTLYTEFLDYNRETGIADYYNGGKVVDSLNVLNSEKGIYETSIEKITFTEKVVLVNPDYTLKTNDLIYKTIPKISETPGLTNIISKDGEKLNAQKGSYYDTQNKIFRFYDGDIETETSIVYAENLFYDEPQKYYEGTVNVSIYNKEREIEIFGEEGKYWEDKKYSKIYGNALVKKYFESDTLLMIADTLISQDGELAKDKYLLAYPQVKILKTELSGKADSLVYYFSDSTIHLFKDPILWKDKNQITADSVRFLIANEEISEAIFTHKAFSVSRDTLGNYNQIKGRRMHGFFEEGNLKRLDILGNGESLYFDLLNDSTLRGMNKMVCAQIQMFFKEGNISRINHVIKPEGYFQPPHLMKEEEKTLEGFVWRIEEKPTPQVFLDWRMPKVRERNFDFFDQPEERLKMPTSEEIEKELHIPKFNTKENKEFLR